MIEMDASTMSELPRFISMARRLSAPGQATSTAALPDAVPSPFAAPIERGGSDRWMGRLRRFVGASAGRSLELA